MANLPDSNHIMRAPLSHVAFKPPRNRYHSMMEAYCDGGPELFKQFKYMGGYIWAVKIIGPNIRVFRDDDHTKYYDIINISEFDFDINQLDLTFDQNMAPFITLPGIRDQETVSYYIATDNTPDGVNSLKQLPGVTYPRCEINYRDTADIAVSDIILSFIKDEALWYAIQSERFLKHYKVVDLDPKESMLWRFGIMTDESFGWIIR